MIPASGSLSFILCLRALRALNVVILSRRNVNNFQQSLSPALDFPDIYKLGHAVS